MRLREQAPAGSGLGLLRETQIVGAIYVRYHASRREAEDLMLALGDDMFAWMVDAFPDETVELQVATPHDGDVHEPT